MKKVPDHLNLAQLKKMKTAFREKRHLANFIFALLLTSLLNFSFAQPLVVGSKRFTESYILSEIFSQTLINSGTNEVIQKSGLGNTGILLSALKTGEIDLYPEYTGTILREILKSNQVLSLNEINNQLKPMGLRAGIFLGFSNSYALAMKEDLANKLGIRTISDLKLHPELIMGLSHEFLARDDGWRGLSDYYQLTSLRPRGLDHGIAYDAIAKDQINVIDAYTTDSKIIQYGLKLLIDDKNFFPSYDALILYKTNVPEKFPRSWQALSQLENQITQKSMLELNALAELRGLSFKEVASYFLKQGKEDMGLSIHKDSKSEQPALSLIKLYTDTFQNNFLQLLMQHLYLVLISLALAILVGVPLGVLCFYKPNVGQIILLAVSAIQTIPSLALLAFLISILSSIGTVPAISALFVYGVLPIIQNTYAGMGEIPKSMRQAACALGLSSYQQLYLIELPLALNVIMSGIKVSAVLTVGNATLAAFVGAGGFGERIAQGLALNDTSMLLAGAIPSALLALSIQALFSHLEKILRNNAHG
jgi:osmoprotectant transport system permease protein